MVARALDLAIENAKLQGLTRLTIAGGLTNANDLRAQGFGIVHVPAESTAWTDVLEGAIWLGPKRRVPGVTILTFPEKRMGLSDLIAEAKQFGKSYVEVSKLTKAEWDECVSHYYYVSYETCFGVFEPFEYGRDKAEEVRVAFVK